MRVLLLGETGQLGWELKRSLAPIGEIYAVDYPQINLLDHDSIRNTVRDASPDLVINATAYTAVDQAESEPEKAMEINGSGPGVLAEIAQQSHIALIHYSTDYVFNGQKGSPYIESDPPNPINVYGLSKRNGEVNIQNVGGAYLILRTSWVYSLRRDSFVTRILNWAKTKEELHIVTDQVGNPTWARFLAETTAMLVARAGTDIWNWIHERHGIYHLAGSGYTNRYHWAEAIIKHDTHKSEHTLQRIIPALSCDFTTAAMRPLFSALECTFFENTFGLKMPEWEKSLQLALEPYSWSD